MMDRNPFAFARKIDAALLQIDRIPLSGNAPKIDLARVAALISKKLNLSSFSIELINACWAHSGDLYEGFETNSLCFNIGLSPLKGEALWITSHRDVAQLTSWTLKKNTNEVQSELLQEGFYLYLLLQVLEELQIEKPFNSFTLRINEKPSSIEYAYCMDFKLSQEERNCFGRLILSDHLLSSWKSHFASLKETFSLSSLTQNLEISLGITVGSVLLNQEQWQELQADDLLLLDRGSYNPRNQEGVASLCIGPTPLFHVSIKENKIKILEPALFYEEDMDKRDATPEQSESNSEAQTMAIKELPLFVTVELSRLRMTIEKLNQLAPGNFLELPLDPTQSVLLTVNGQKIGRGELVYLGEALGVRILETT